MSKNIDDFNVCVAVIMGKLYENFPNLITLSMNEFPCYEEIKQDDTTDEMNEKALYSHERYLLYFHTTIFLLDEGFIRGKKVEGHTVFRECVLTSKGLAKLRKVPKSVTINHNQHSVGELFGLIGKGLLKSTATETIKIGLDVLLSGH